ERRSNTWQGPREKAWLRRREIPACHYKRIREVSSIHFSFTMKFCVQTPCLFLAFIVCTQLYKAHVGEGTFVPSRCRCPEAYRVVRGPFVNFAVHPKGPHCSTDEIIVMLKRTKKEVCLSPDGPQGRKLLKCWNRVNQNGGNKNKCLRKRNQKKQQRRKEPARSRGATS
ncbi:hypothetical protein AAFF_G00138900, partial [Aldrovandia affinis]